jgi:hypothetical protein
VVSFLIFKSPARPPLPGMYTSSLHSYAVINPPYQKRIFNSKILLLNQAQHLSESSFYLTAASTVDSIEATTIAANNRTCGRAEEQNLESSRKRSWSFGTASLCPSTPQKYNQYFTTRHACRHLVGYEAVPPR